jgi:hypothetical protein
LESVANLLWRFFFIFTKNKIMALVCLTDLIYKGKKYREGDAIKVDPAKVSVFIAKGWAFRPDSALNEIEVDAKEVKAKRETKEFDLPFGPITSVALITIDGTATTAYEILGLDNETIELDQGSAERVKITYITAGLNDSLLKQAMLQLISTYYDNRAEFVEGSVSEVPTNVRMILSSYKTMFI